MAVQGNIDSNERAARIRGTLETAGRVRISELARELSVSEMTIRRDLQELEALGVARRVRGGAVVVGPVGPVYFDDRNRHQAHAKARIAKKLLRLIPSTGAVGIDASSTMLRLATAIDGARDLTVLTNSLETFSGLQGKPGLAVLLTGGELEPRTGSLVGPLALRAAGELRLKRLFVSAAAVDPKLGSSEASLPEAEVKRVLGGGAEEVVLGVDSSKLSSRAMAHGFSWDQIKVLVTDLDPQAPDLDPYRAAVEIL